MAAQTLLTDATAFQSYDKLPSLQVACYLLAQIAGAPYSTMTAQQLLTASGAFQILGDELTALQVADYLLSNIQSGGGGGGGSGTQVYSGDYGGASPAGFVTLPSGVTTAIAFDTSKGRQWAFFSGVWN